MLFFFLGLLFPAVASLLMGSSYVLALSISTAGIVLYVVNAMLIRWFIAQRAPYLANNEDWELTAGTGIVPRWVSKMGLFGLGLMPSGLLVALLLLLDIASGQ